MEFEPDKTDNTGKKKVKFPSPCGVMEFEQVRAQADLDQYMFPSPCGVMEFEPGDVEMDTYVYMVSVPLRGNGI